MGTYVLPLVKYSRGWGPMTPSSVMAHRASSIAVTDLMATGQNEVAERLGTLSLEAMRQELDATARDPLAEMFWHLPPEERVSAVGVARRNTSAE